MRLNQRWAISRGTHKILTKHSESKRTYWLRKLMTLSMNLGTL